MYTCIFIYIFIYLYIFIYAFPLNPERLQGKGMVLFGIVQDNTACSPPP